MKHEEVSAIKCLINETSYTNFSILRLFMQKIAVLKFGEFCGGW
jgi:hypothetical protein